MRSAWAAAAAIFVVGVGVLLFLRGGAPSLVEGHSEQRGDGVWHDNASSDAGLPPRSLLLTYASGRQASFTLTVRNTGKRKVRLTGAYVLGRNLMFSPRPAVFEPAPGTSGRFKPRTAVDVAPGQEVAAVVTGVFTNCDAYEPGSETSTRTLSVDYRDGDATRTLAVPLRNDIRVTAPESCS